MASRRGKAAIGYLEVVLLKLREKLSRSTDARCLEVESEVGDLGKQVAGMEELPRGRYSGRGRGR